MEKLNEIHMRAVKMTKEKIHEDEVEYLGSKGECPTVREYISDRRHYIEDLWLNIWINQVKNNVSKADKRVFLAERGYETDHLKRKVLNQLFENEIRDYQPFDAIHWLEESFFENADQWKEKYERARARFLKLEKERLLVKKRKSIQEEILKNFKSFIQKKKLMMYVMIRYEVAKKITTIFQENKKYILTKNDELKEMSALVADNYSTINELLPELTGKTMDLEDWYFYIEFETYDDIIGEMIHDIAYEQALLSFMGEQDDQLFLEFEEAFTEPLTLETVIEIVGTAFERLVMDYFEMIREEEVANLLELARTPFNEEEQLEWYRRDREARKRKKQERQLALEREKEREAWILEDIFSREYNPPLGRNIHYVLHIGETNTGKTHHALQHMKQASSGLYLAPLRLLALEVYDKLNNEDVPCNLKTGEEEKEVTGANHISSTVEMFSEKEEYDVIVIDEAQMIADKDRGFSWYKAITKANAKEVHIIGSINSKEMILQLLGDSQVEVNEYEREIPLQVEKKEFNLKQTKKGDALVCFSRRRVLETASSLENSGHRVSMIYGSMPPETRKKQIQRFIHGETKVVVATDAIGMGLNLPIRRIVFLENEKFDGTRRRLLTSQEVKQIAGRAGRKGIYDVGKVAFTKDVKRMKSLLRREDNLVQTFAIAPTAAIFERFQKYYRDLGKFFELWDKFESPKGTKKATLYEERELYETIRGTEIDAKLPMMELYGFLHLPFSQKESQLINQWRNTMVAIVRGTDLPEPRITRKSLEDLELAYKAIGLHLLFLYRLGRKTEAIYWERLREEISDDVHESLKRNVKKFSKKCKRCGRNLPYDFRYPICNKCHAQKYRRNESFRSNGF